MVKIQTLLNLINALTIYDIFISIYISIVSARYVPQFEEIFKEIGGELPFTTQLILNSYRWIWLGAIFSFVVWLTNKRHIISKKFSLSILACFALFGTTYISIMPSALQQPLFDVFDLMNK